jgi:hypothetical protein
MRLAPWLMRSESPTRKNEKGQSHRGRAAGVGVNRSSFLVGDLLPMGVW